MAKAKQTRVTENLRITLESLGDCQRPLLERLGDLEPSKDVLTRYGLALEIEVSEFLNELPWKTWKPGMEFDRERLTDEYADILAFLGSWVALMKEMGIDETTLATAYATKLERNHARFDGTSGEAGYTGVDELRVSNG